MVKKNELKKEILMDSFNILKDNIYKNSEELKDLILKMIVLDTDLAVEMWSYLLREFKEIGQYGNETYHLTCGIIFDMDYSGLVSREKIASLVYENDIIVNKIYKEAACPDDVVVSYYIDTKDFHKANYLLEKVYSNSNHDTWGRDEDAFGYYLNEMLKYKCKSITSESVNFMLDWAEKASNENKAKLKIKLLDYM